MKLVTLSWCEIFKFITFYPEHTLPKAILEIHQTSIRTGFKTKQDVNYNNGVVDHLKATLQDMQTKYIEGFIVVVFMLHK